MNTDTIEKKLAEVLAELKKMKEKEKQATTIRISVSSPGAKEYHYKLTTFDPIQNLFAFINEATEAKEQAPKETEQEIPVLDFWNVKEEHFPGLNLQRLRDLAVSKAIERASEVGKANIQKLQVNAAIEKATDEAFEDLVQKTINRPTAKKNNQRPPFRAAKGTGQRKKASPLHKADSDYIDSLAPRAKELVASGMTQRQAGEALGVSRTTIYYLVHDLRNHGVRSKAELQRKLAAQAVK